MMKFKRFHEILNLSYVFSMGINIHCIDSRETQVVNSMKDVIFTPIAKNLKYPSFDNHQIPLFYSTGLNCVNPKASNEKSTFAGDEIEINSDFENDGGVYFSGEDSDIENSQLGVQDEKLKIEIGVILDILRGFRSKGISVSGEFLPDKPVVVSGAKVTKKLNECGVTPTSELVVEVLSRIRNDWQMGFAFFLWAGKQPGYAHSVREYHLMLAILTKRRKFDTCWILIDEMTRGEIVKPDTLWIMIRRYCAAHDVAGAINTFHAFKRFKFHLGVEEFHKLLCALARYKNVEDAEHLLFSNKNTFPFSTKSFNIVLNGWCNVLVSPREANRFWRLMIDQGIKLDVFSFSIIISSYSKLNRLKEVLRFLELMKEMGIDPDRKVYNAVIHALANAGLIKEALNLMGTMEEKGISPNAVTYNSLIKPLSKARKRDEAEKVLAKMLSTGLRPTIQSFHALLHIQRTSEEIFVLLDKMKEFSCHPNKDTYLLLIRKFCRWRQLDHVCKLWDHMTENGWNDDESSYIALIHGLFLNGKLEEAYNLYTEMKHKSLLPDERTDKLMNTWLSNKQMSES